MAIGKWMFVFGCAATYLCGNQVVQLVPPKLEKGSVAATIPCVRPMRDGTFNISCGEVRQKLVVNCYGHGGCGWTTFMGSVDRALELFVHRYPDPSLTPPIRVLGAGCMGLCSAIELKRRGYRVAGVFTKELYNIPSWNAAGYYALVSLKTFPEEMEVINRINLSTFAYYQAIEQDRHPYLSSKAVRFLPVYCSSDTHSGVEELEEAGMIPPKEIVDIDFGNGVIHCNFQKFMTYFFDVTTLMQELHSEIKRLGVPIEMKAIHQFEDVEEEVIFNCAGLGGGELIGDPKMIPVRGHLVLLNENAGSEHLNYMIYTKVIQDGKEEYVYLFPRSKFINGSSGELYPSYGVLGGSFIRGVEMMSTTELDDFDAKEFERLLNRNASFFQGVPFVSGENAGD